MEISQLVAGFSTGDAISNEARALQGLFRSWGYKSEIYVDVRFLSPELRGACRDHRRYLDNDSPDNIIIFHFSIGSRLTDFVRKLRAGKVVIYHNITPAEYYRGINPRAAETLERGREELKSFADVPELALGDSEYNTRELVELGYRNTAVLPLLLDLEKFDRTTPDKDVMNQFGGTATSVLFVGRVVPNKKFEDVIKTFYIYQNTCEANSRLFLIGGYDDLDPYYTYLCGLIRELDVRNVWFGRHVTFPELVAYYRLADVYLSMSEHEGYGIPLIESMHCGIPVLAYDAAAVKETMGGAGVLIGRKDHERIAEMIDLVTKDARLRKSIVSKQRRRLGSIRPEAIAETVRQHLGPWLK